MKEMNEEFKEPCGSFQTRRSFMMKSLGMAFTAGFCGISTPWARESGQILAQSIMAQNSAVNGSAVDRSSMIVSPVPLTVNWAEKEWDPNLPFMMWGKAL